MSFSGDGRPPRLGNAPFYAKNDAALRGVTRRELAVASGAAVVATLGDLLLLFVGNSARPELGLPRPPELALPLGALLGVCAIPAYALGYRAVARAIRPGSRPLARVVLVCGSAAAAIGALIHGLTALTIRAAIESGASAAPPMEAVAASGTGLVAAWITASLLFLAASIAVFAARALPRSVTWLNPLAVTVVLVLAGLPWEWGRSFLVPAAPNLAHVVFFLVALSTLGESPA